MAQAIFSTPAASCSTPLGVPGDAFPDNQGNRQQLAFLDMIFPGFSMLSDSVQRYTGIDLNLYIPVLMLVGGSLFAWQYVGEYAYQKLDTHFMSKCTLRTDDEAYNYVMAWISKQNFSLRSRRFIANTNTDSRSWFTWKWRDEDEEENEFDGDEATRKPLSYTPDFGSHYFFYRKRLLIFSRSQNREQFGYSSSTSKEEISISCFGRDPTVLKELLIEARDLYLKRDERKTSIYRGSTKGASSEASWQRCMARTSRPFSTVILNESVKKDLIDDVTDYLDPATRRWYSNRGIPYRRGYLLHGPPGTGKSSLSLALAGFFKMRIYIVSLSSIVANEETLATLFGELPRRCVVLLEDIDSAGLTHTREDANGSAAATGAAAGSAETEMVPGQLTEGRPMPPPASGRLSLSGLLNILDGVASQEGRVLIMTTNHIEKLDKALIRPGRVDMTVHFGLADAGMMAAIFRAIYAPLEGDEEPAACSPTGDAAAASSLSRGSAKELASIMAAAAHKSAELEKRQKEEEEARAKEVERVAALAEQFAAKIPAHEFSPAELQGFLMKHKRDAAAAVANAEEWVVATRKEKKQKELEEAEERRRKADADAAEVKKKKEGEEKKKEEEEKKEKRKEKKEARRAKRKTTKKSKRKAGGEDSGSGSSDDSSDDDEAAADTEDSKASAAAKPEGKDSGYET